MILCTRVWIFCMDKNNKMIQSLDIDSNKSKFYSNYPKKMISMPIMLKKSRQF